MKWSFALGCGLAVLLLSCSDEKTTGPTLRLPTVTTASVTNITQATAECGGEITSDGGAAVTARGVCWSTLQTPTTADSITVDGAGTGSFVSSLVGLTSDTPYYVRAYATNSVGTGYGSSVAFSTAALSPPTLTTAAVTAATQSSAMCGGEVISDGGATVTARGVCWSANPEPTVADSITTDGMGTGSFMSSLSGLMSNTPYHVRAYATNSIGTGYGNSLSFTTAPTLTDIDGNGYQTVIIGTQVWMAENLKVTHYRNGDAIPHVMDTPTWVSLTTGAYCEYNNDMNNVAVYGRLYNSFAVRDGRNIAPTGWHVPTTAEWWVMVDFLGGEHVAGGKLKETGTAHWISPNTGATNESGFSARPGGGRGDNGASRDLGVYALFYTATECNAGGELCVRFLESGSVICPQTVGRSVSGLSIRCVKD